MTYTKKLERIIKKNISNYDDLDLNSENGTLTVSTQDFNNFLQAIDQSFEASEIKTQQAERSLEISSRELAESNQKLFSMNNTMKTILDSLEEGLVLFNKDAICDKFSSRAGENHFGKNFVDSETNFTHLFSDNTDKQSEIKEWIDLLFSGNFDFQQINDLGPSWVSSQDSRKIHIKYKPIYDINNNLEKVLVITNDITAELKAMAEAESQKGIAKTIIEICNTPQLFSDLKETLKILNNDLKKIKEKCITNWPEELDNNFKGKLHTVKGTIGSFNNSQAVEKIHSFETEFIEANSDDKKSYLAGEIIDYINSVEQEVTHQFDFVLNKLVSGISNNNDDFGDKINDFLSELNQTKNKSLENSFKRKFILKKFTDQFNSYNKIVEQLGEKLNKQIKPIKFIGDDIFVNTEKYKGLLSSFIHIFRNIADHGIEDSNERLSSNKSPEGNIFIECKEHNGQIKLKIKDDGRGISKNKILEKIKNTPLEQKYLNKDNFLNCIFEPSFSTKEEVTDLSGRGIGLNEVLSEVQKLNGKVEVTSIEGQGTTFEFTLPLYDDYESYFSKAS